MEDKLKPGSNRSFGLVFFVVFLLIALYPILNDNTVNIVLLVTSIVFLILGLVNSKLLSPLNFLWFKFGILIGKLISPLIMGFIFFLVVTPIGLLMKLFRKDLLNLKFNNKETYWIKKEPEKLNMKDQF